MHRSRWLAGIFTVGLVACGGTTGAGSSSDLDTGSVVGTVGGAPIVIDDAIASVSGTLAQLALTSTPDACADVRDSIARSNSATVVMLLTDNDPADTQLTAGTYTTSDQTPSPTRWAGFETNVTDAQCNVSYDPAPDGTGDGTVTLTAVDGNTLTGTFDMQLESGEHITGAFTTGSCPELAAAHDPASCTP